MTASTATGCPSRAPPRSSNCPRQWTYWSTTTATRVANTPTGTTTGRRWSAITASCCGSRSSAPGRTSAAESAHAEPRRLVGRLRPGHRDVADLAGRATALQDREQGLAGVPRSVRDDLDPPVWQVHCRPGESERLGLLPHP